MFKGGCLQHLVFLLLLCMILAQYCKPNFYSSANYFQPRAFSSGLTHHSDSNPHHCCGLLFRKWAHDDTQKIKSQTSFGRHCIYSPFSITSCHHAQSLHKGDDKQKMKVGIEKEIASFCKEDCGKSTFSGFILTIRFPECHRNEAV